MGSLNCQKCINDENKNIDEILIEKNEYESRKIITALESQETNATPRKTYDNLTKEKLNRLNNININEEDFKKKILKIYSEFKKGNKDILYDLDYNTLEVVYNDSDSYGEFYNKYSDNENEQIEEFDEYQKILLANGNNNLNLNDFINQKIKESRQAQIRHAEEDEDDIKYINKEEIINNPDNYKIIYDNNNQFNNFKFINFSDFELSDDDINNDKKIIEEKEEYENEESSKEKKIKSIDCNNLNKSSKENSKQKTDNNRSSKRFTGKSITSYEIESE